MAQTELCCPISQVAENVAFITPQKTVDCPTDKLLAYFSLWIELFIVVLPRIDTDL